MKPTTLYIIHDNAIPLLAPNSDSFSKQAENKVPEIDKFNGISF